MTGGVREALPPAPLVAALNPVMRVALRTPLGRWVRPFALLEFTGRRSGRRLRVPVGWHYAEGSPVVFSPAPRWPTNFRGGRAATVHHRGQSQQLVGILVTDPEEVARTLRVVLAAGTSPGLIGLDVPAGHQVTAADVLAVGKAMVRFAPTSPRAQRDRPPSALGH